MMQMMKWLALAVALAATGCGNKSCKDACSKINSCSFNSSGLSCDSNCGSPDDACAVCVNDKSCDEILAGDCASDCPKATFTKN